MYKTVISYQWGKGWRIRSTIYTRTKIGARIMVFYTFLFKNKEFFKVNYNNEAQNCMSY